MAAKNLLFLAFILLQGLTIIHALEADFVSHGGASASEEVKMTSGECCAGGYTGIYIDLSGEPLNYQFGLVGDYIMQDDLVNGRNYWIKDNGRYGIWFAEKNGEPYAWIVGSIGNLGTTTGGLASACTEDCGFCCQEWQYSNYAGQWQISSDIVLMVDGVCSAMCEI